MDKLSAAKAEKKILDLVGALYIDAQIADLPNQIQNEVLNFDNVQSIFFYGPVGTGKTYAMAAMIREYIYMGYECIRINFDDFCVDVRSTMSPASKLTEYEMIKPLKEVDILFIDDLGIRSKQETDFAYVTLYSLLNKRLEYCLPTIVSSNKNIEQLGQSFDERIASRLQVAKQIEMTGKDRRKT
jgi:DNA replication protein DnaC